MRNWRVLSNFRGSPPLPNLVDPSLHLIPGLFRKTGHEIDPYLVARKTGVPQICDGPPDILTVNFPSRFDLFQGIDGLQPEADRLESSAGHEFGRLSGETSGVDSIGQVKTTRKVSFQDLPENGNKVTGGIYGEGVIVESNIEHMKSLNPVGYFINCVTRASLTEVLLEKRGSTIEASIGTPPGSDKADVVQM